MLLSIMVPLLWWAIIRKGLIGVIYVSGAPGGKLTVPSEELTASVRKSTIDQEVVISRKTSSSPF